MPIFEYGWTWGGFVWGCVGAAAPQVLKLYQLSQQKHDKVDIRWWQVAGSIMFALFAGFVTAGLLAPPTIVAAFYNGIAMPYFISLAAGKEMTP